MDRMMASSGPRPHPEWARIERDIDKLLDLRQQVDDLLRPLIDMLDFRDAPAADLEPSLGSVATHERESQAHWASGDRDDREPSLGSVADHERVSQRFWHSGNTDDREADYADGEPSLASPETVRIKYWQLAQVPWIERQGRHVDPSCSQVCWARGDDRDLEDEHDGREPSVDDEPSLGADEPRVSQRDGERDADGRLLSVVEVFGDQSLWGRGGTNDLEDDPAEDGIGDEDGLHEQVGCEHRPGKS